MSDFTDAQIEEEEDKALNAGIEDYMEELAQILYAYDTSPELDKQKHRQQARGVLEEWAPDNLPALLAGISELATRFDVKPNTVTVWTIRHDDFPDPLVTIGGRAKVWWVPDVDAWYESRLWA